MASMYYMCADCGDAVQEIKMTKVVSHDTIIGEYCNSCNNWNPEVIIGCR